MFLTIFSDKTEIRAGRLMAARAARREHILTHSFRAGFAPLGVSPAARRLAAVCAESPLGAKCRQMGLE